jgi:hypothetical protein
MILIHGNSSTGKSHTVFSKIDNSKKVLYFALDFDKRIKALELKNKNLQVTAFPKGTFLSDIEFEILNHGGLFQNYLSYVVIDPINFLMDDLSLEKLIKKLSKIEKEYNKFKLILTINTLYHFELNSEILKIKDLELIESTKNNVTTF